MEHLTTESHGILGPRRIAQTSQRTESDSSRRMFQDCLCDSAWTEYPVDSVGKVLHVILSSFVNRKASTMGWQQQALVHHRQLSSSSRSSIFDLVDFEFDQRNTLCPVCPASTPERRSGCQRPHLSRDWTAVD